MEPFPYVPRHTKNDHKKDAVPSSSPTDSSHAVHNPQMKTHISTIGEYDVALGRNGFSQQHIGNRRFRKLIHSFGEEYQKTRCRQDKVRITRQVINIISQRGGRFLKYGEQGRDETEWKEGWYEVGKDDTYEKVSHALRSRTVPTVKQAPKSDTKGI
jgi:hypothetical protein